MTFADLLLREGWLDLESLTVAGDGRLRVVISDQGKPPARFDPSYIARYFELVWNRYFTFMVCDEGSAAFRPEEKYQGYGVRIFQESWFLKVIPELSNGLHEIPDVRGSVRHFGVYCSDQVIDVLAYEEPMVNEFACPLPTEKEPNKAPEPTTMAVTPRATS